MAYAFVQQNAADNAASATTITVTLTPTAGNLLVFCVSGDSLDSTSIALSDNLGGGGSSNTFSQIGTDLVASTDQRCAWWYAANCKGGATTFTATFSAGTRFRTIYVAEYSGIVATSPLLNGARAENANPGTGTDAVSSGNANATSQPALVWGFCIDTNGGTTPTAGTGYTSRTGVWSTATCLGRPEDKRVTSTGNVAATFTATTGTDTHGSGVGIFAEAASATIDQSAFRFYNDDGSESAMTGAAAESTNLTKPLGTNLILRQQIAATGDPASTAYKLRYQKNGSGGYADVQVGTTIPEVFGSVTFGAIGTGANGSTTVAPSYPAGIAAGHYLTCHVSSGATNSETPTTPSGWTLLATGASTDGTFGIDTGPRRMTVFGKIADGTESGTLTVSITNGDTCRGTIARWVKSGSGSWVVDAQGANDSGAHTAISMTFGAIDWHTGDATLVATGQRVDNATQSSQSLTASGITFGARTNQAATAVTTGNDHRHTVDTFAAITAGSGSQAATWSYTASAAASAGGVIVRLREYTAPITNEVYVSTSSNISASGEATTARLSVPGGKSFTTGRIWDDENGTDSIDVATDNYTELAWCLQAQSPAANGDFYDFRVYAGAAALDSYTVTPRLTIGSSSGAGSAAGTSTVTGVSPSNTGAGSSAGTGSATAVGASTASTTGSSAGTSTASAVPGTGTIFPLTISSDGRYLKKSDGTPFLIKADTTWSLFVDIPLTGTRGVDAFLNDITGKGFNAVSGNVIEHHYTVVKPPKNQAGDLPFTKTLNGSTFTGSPNGTTSSNGTQGQFAADNYSNINNQAPDPTFPNSAYWTACETILDACKAHNVAVFVWPFYLGFHAGDEGWMQELVAWDAVTGAGGFTGLGFANATKSKAWNYGAWLADRWKAYPHIIWVAGGDYGSGGQTLDTQQKAAVESVISGMKSVSGQQSVFWTAHWDRDSISTDTALTSVTFDINGSYCAEAVAERTRQAYAHSPTSPAMVIEWFYENDLFGGSAPYRKYMYWAFLGGIAGGFFGEEQIWRFDDGTPGTDYTTLLNTQGTLDAVRLFAFWDARPWWRLKPSGLGGMGTLITAGGGTASPQSTTYVAAAATSEGDLLLAYIPPDHTGSITVDMTKVSATVQARWFDPANATFTTIGAFANTGTHAFTPSGNNSAGDADWLLVLETPAGTSAGVGAASGVGAALASTPGASTGTGTATATGQSIAAAAGTASGTSTATASAAVVRTGDGVAAGVGAASGVGASTAAATGATTGAGSAAAAGAALAAGGGGSAGIAAASGVGAAAADASGAASGVGSALAVSADLADAVGSATGIAAAAAVGAALAAGAGTSAASSAATAAGASVDAGAGSAAGVAAAAAVGQSLAAASGSAAGVSAGAATGQSTASTTGTSAGTGAAAGVGASSTAGQGVGTATGTATAAAVGGSTWAASGAAAGSSTASGIGAEIIAAAGVAAGLGTATGAGAVAGAGSAGVAAGTSVAIAAGESWTSGTGSAGGTSTATASGVSGSMGIAAGTSTATAPGWALAEATGTAAGASSAAAITVDATTAWENAIYHWVLTGSELAPSQVIWADVGNGGPAPTGLYISMRIIDVDQVSDDWLIPRRVGGAIVHHVRGTRHPMLELRCFAGDSTGARRAELVLARVMAAVMLPSVAKALRQGDVGVGTGGPVRVLPGVRSGMLDPLAMVTVQLHIKIDVSEAGAEFVSVDATTPGGTTQRVEKP